MQIDIKLLEKCPELSDYEENLIISIDVKGERQVNVAKSLGKSPSTISTQHRKALEKLNAWLKKRGKKEKVLPEEDFDKQAFQRFNQGWPPNKVIADLGKAERVFKLWEKHQKIMQDDYCAALNILHKWIKKEECSEYPVEQYPLSARVEKLRWDEFTLSLEHGSTWDLLKENALTFGLEDGDFSVYEAVKRLVDKIDKTPKRAD